MDGTFAVLTLVFGMHEAFDECRSDCLARHEVQDRISVSQGSLQYQGEVIGREIYARYDTKLAHGPFQTIVGASYSSLGDIWAGIGHSYTLAEGETGPFAEVHAMTGLYLNGSGPDLGGLVEFRSGAELGYRWESGLRVGLSYDHRSNAGIFPNNPGIETVQLRVSVPLR